MPPTTAEVLGIDVSHYNGVVDWKAVAAAGAKFAYAKATEGANTVDTKFAANWVGIKQAGLLRGAYHFFHPAKPVQAQAERFLSAVAELTPGDLPPMLDLEETSAQKDEWPGIPKGERVALALEWLDRVAQALGRKPIVYTRKGFVTAMFGQPGRLTEHPLWVAHYTKTAPAPRIPPGWDKWTLWQYTGSGTFAGVKGQVDINRFNGTALELAALAGVAADAVTA